MEGLRGQALANAGMRHGGGEEGAMSGGVQE